MTGRFSIQIEDVQDSKNNNHKILVVISNAGNVAMIDIDANTYK